MNDVHYLIKPKKSDKTYISIKKNKKKSNVHNKIIKIVILILFFVFIKKNFIDPISFNNIENKTNNDTNCVHVAVSVDNKFLYPCIIFITSLLENRNPTTYYNIYLLTSPNNIFDYKDKINSLINKYEKKFINISYLNMNDDFKGSITGTHVSIATYYKIALPSLLPNLDRVIYCDADIISFKDLSQMYNLELKDDIYMRGRIDNSHLLKELRRIGVITDRYMNAGILLMNLKSMRKNKVEQKIRIFIKSHYLDHHDQTAINGVCHKNWDLLPLEYSSYFFRNYTNFVKFLENYGKKCQYSEREYKQALNNQALLHYCGWIKPWHLEYKHFTLIGKYWWYYAKQSGFYDEILEYYRFNKKDIEKIISMIPDDGGFIKNNFKKNCI